MREPDNHTVLEGRGGDMWVRYDERPSPLGPWRRVALCGVGVLVFSVDWEEVLEFQPLYAVTGAAAGLALDKVREELGQS